VGDKECSALCSMKFTIHLKARCAQYLACAELWNKLNWDDAC
jgi:hypothetical protein